MDECMNLVVYVDVDDTLVRSAGTKRIPIMATVEHVRSLHAQGAQLFCWSAGGAEYARQSAAQCGIEQCFAAFLPKPQVMIDDQHVNEWGRFLAVHPMNCVNESAADYLRRLA